MEIGAEPKKLILLGVLVLVAGATYLLLVKKPSVLPNSVLFVCVETGQQHWFSRDEIPGILPARNPKTGRDTLLPAEERDGKLYIVERYADPLATMSEVNKRVDPQTLEVRKS